MVLKGPLVLDQSRRKGGVNKGRSRARNSRARLVRCVRNKRTEDTAKREPCFLIGRVRKKEKREERSENTDAELQNNSLPAKLETSRRDHREHRLKEKEKEKKKGTNFPPGGTWQQFIKVSFSTGADKSRTN